MNSKTKRANNQVNSVINVQEQREMVEKANHILSEMKSFTWRDLETQGKFSKNDKLSFISDDMLILGCDIGSETHYARAIDARGRELGRKALAFDNNAKGFQKARDWAVQLAAANDKKQIVLGLEPTGHYWFCLAAWMVSNGISVVQVNPYAVKQTKELEDNSQQKDDRKDPKLIANLVKDGNYGMPYLPEKVYAELRRLSMFREQLTEDRNRNMNRLHREMKIYFPEYKDAFGKIDGAFCMAVLKEAPFPEDILRLGIEGIREIWHEAKLRGRGYSRAAEIVKYAEMSIGLKEGTAAGKEAVRWFAEKIMELDEELEKIENSLSEKCKEIPHAENVLEIPGIGGKILSGILAEMGDISRFDDVKELQKLSGLGLVSCSSGKHKGETRISHRGRKRLRYWLFQAARSAVSHGEEYKRIHAHYTTRAGNPLQKMQSLIVIACKLLRVIYTMLKTGKGYDPEKLLKDIRYPENVQTAAA
ncbi:MAG: IS110 family transposase [[Clostridium] scindens]|uniref:Transposase n=1 Tax=Hespellia stercorisuis DSM 15480 TaxID=1121950 RepID=A0A1M6W945_9FIRM|nr:IS110 family transposase [Hespellia stercorisuis]SHK90159.1 Transposase [Hespellia stercorisuis DSM 15480]